MNGARGIPTLAGMTSLRTGSPLITATTATRRRDTGLLAIAVLLTAAFFLVPSLLGPDRGDEFPGAFAAYWSAGGPHFPPGLQRLVDHQYWYHLVRVLIAVPLLAVLVALAVRLRRLRLPIGALALVTAVALIENVQGFVSPFGTLLPLLAPATVLAQINDQFAHGAASPALTVMLDEYVRWHVVKAVLSGLLAVVLLGLSVAVYRRRRRWYSLLTAVPAVAVVLVVVANVLTVADPHPGFLLLLRVPGSWCTTFTGWWCGGGGG